MTNDKAFTLECTKANMAHMHDICFPPSQSGKNGITD